MQDRIALGRKLNDQFEQRIDRKTFRMNVSLAAAQRGQRIEFIAWLGTPIHPPSSSDLSYLLSWIAYAILANHVQDNHVNTTMMMMSGEAGDVVEF